MKSGDYIAYDSTIYGKGAGQVIDVIVRDNKEIVLCEPLYSKKDRRSEKQLDTIIGLDVDECKVSTKMNTHQRMRFR